jgi:hypothetical protein
MWMFLFPVGLLRRSCLRWLWDMTCAIGNVLQLAAVPVTLSQKRELVWFHYAGPTGQVWLSVRYGY